jgi:hypothetical protein
MTKRELIVALLNDEKPLDAEVRVMSCVDIGDGEKDAYEPHDIIQVHSGWHHAQGPDPENAVSIEIFRNEY